MKRVLFLLLLFLVMISSNAQALKWTAIFVVWDGRVYEVKEGESIDDIEIGKNIGEVNTEVNEETGSYWGNASNEYPKGTKYFEIKGTQSSSAIAVKEDNHWIKAVYAYEAPFHIMNILTNFYFLATVVIVGLTIGVFIYRNYKTTLPR